MVHQLPLRPRSSHGVLSRRNRRVDRRKQVPSRPPPAPCSRSGSKKNSARGLLHSFEQLWRDGLPIHPQVRVNQRAEALALSSLLCLGRRTVTGLLSTCGQQFLDWSAAYRLFSHHRVSTDRLFDNVHHAVQVLLPSSQPLCLAIDDTLLRRTGTHTHGVAWRRDPLGPKFHTNFVRAQRYLQISAAVPSQQNPNAVRMVPLDFWHCPTPVRPRAKATAEQKTQYRQDAKRMNLSVQLIARLQRLCNPAPTDPHSPRRPIHLLVDGQYTNGRVLKNLPPGTTLIGRIRKDAKLYYQPIAAASARRGRRRSYGALAPTPEQIRTTEDPWETVEVFAAGITHQCRVKTVTGLLWRTAGLGLLLKLVVIAPLHYRPRSGSKLLYRRPAFLICTDPAGFVNLNWPTSML